MRNEQAPDAAARGACDRLAAAGVEVVRVIHADLFGRARSKQYPLSALPELAAGVGYCAASLVEGLDGIPLEGGGFPADNGFPDLHAVPDLGTLRVVPWQPHTAWVLADVYEQGARSPLCVRDAVRRVCDAAASVRGVEPVVAAEPEFYLVSADDRRRYSPAAGMAYTTGRRADPTGVFDRIHRALLRFGIGVTSAHREFSPGQFELNLHHAPALGAADAAFLLKEAVKELALGEGLQAVFMAKPFADSEGSSLHLHVSLTRAGKNIFAGNDQLSGDGEAFVDGVVTHAAALTALAAPTVNSYKRLVPGAMAPRVASAAGDDRMAYVRVPQGTGAGARVEVRGGDASANPYLLIAAVLASGIAGGRRTRKAAVALPTSLPVALDALEADAVVRGALGGELVRIFAAIKRREAAQYAAAVTDWEWATYAGHA
jgi:glutamine synthetase